MIKQLFLLTGIIVFLNISALAQQYPFPQHTDYHSHIKPSQYTQEELDQQVKTFYDQWKEKYLINGCENDQYYVFFDSGNTITVSEAMGYGMLIVPLMAGYDPEAHNIFNGLYRYYKAHPSHIMPHLMAWKQITDCKDADGPDSASDGDIDIAFGLLLAHAQWGSAGAINYFQEALLIIKDMMGDDAVEGDINQDYFTVKLGDWVQSGTYMKSTRTSDFIMDHFRTFACAIHDTTWNQVVDKCYDLVDVMQSEFSPESGLLPDFIVSVNAIAQPAPPNFLEGPLDGNYSYNACRDPWRLTNDYLINGDERAKNAVLKIDQWLLESTGGSTNKIYAGYYLDGSKAVGWSDIAFTAPFAVGAMIDTTNQEWLNKLYSKILSTNIANGGYYDNTLKMLAMITLSGNYWVPSCDILNGTPDVFAENENLFRVYPTATTGKLTVEIEPELSGENLSVKIFNILGKIIVSENIENKPVSIISINDFPAGMYLITLTGKNGKPLGTRKIFKQ